LYCALGLHPGMAFSSELATAAVGRPDEEVERLLDSLVEANLLNEAAEGRFEFADLIRLHARHRAMRNAKHPYGATERRIIEWYLHTTRAADRILAPYRNSPGYEYRTDVTHHPQLADRQQALRWLDAERLNLIAVTRLAHDQGMAEVTWHLCDALWSLFLYRRHYPDRLEIDRLGVASAKAWGNPVAEADMLKRLGRLYGLTGDFEKAFDLLHEAIELNRRCGTTAGEADALGDLGRVHLALGETGRAWELLTDSLRIHRERGDERSVALTLINCGLVDLEAGDQVASIERFEQALEILERYRESDPYNHARALIALGKALVRVRRHDEALGFLTHGLDIMSEYESEYRLAEISGLLGEIAEATGDRGGALRQYRKALQTYLGLGAHEAQEIEQRITALNGGRQGEV
jgi:tetratricopeptide (TPR) repeat protein